MTTTALTNSENLSELEYCPNKGDGCVWKGLRGKELDKHLEEECAHSEVKCKHCSDIIMRRDTKTHEDKCLKRPEVNDEHLNVSEEGEDAVNTGSEDSQSQATCPNRDKPALVVDDDTNSEGILSQASSPNRKEKTEVAAAAYPSTSEWLSDENEKSNQPGTPPDFESDSVKEVDSGSITRNKMVLSRQSPAAHVDCNAGVDQSQDDSLNREKAIVGTNVKKKERNSVPAADSGKHHESDQICSNGPATYMYLVENDDSRSETYEYVSSVSWSSPEIEKMQEDSKSIIVISKLANICTSFLDRNVVPITSANEILDLQLATDHHDHMLKGVGLNAEVDDHMQYDVENADGYFQPVQAVNH